MTLLNNDQENVENDSAEEAPRLSLRAAARSGPEPLRAADGLWRKVGHLLRRDVLGIAATTYLVLLLLTTVVGSFVLADSARNTNLHLRFVPPLSTQYGWEYVLGSDALGRSFLAQLTVAARTTLLISIGAVIAAAVVGALIGTVVGYARGRLDKVAMRIADVMLAFPSLLLALIVLYTLGAGLGSLILVLALARIAMYTRVARAETLAVRERVFIRASRAFGAGSLRIVCTQILPVIANPLVALATLEFALVMLAESALSFLGLGVHEPDVTWGGLIAEGRNYLQHAWWIALLPGLAITLTAIATNVLAELVRKAAESE
ncbi:ABC transporter permease [Micromonospora globispora]|uniref:ABC transporter permease n=1 Tax=Micromonospora globispora TaxID=1450148 RepID=UPI000D6F301A|nr:ABC transporter permease [Micromonospora globispora]PWU55415.1 ABC transporter permease [Micromonospora globispora]RQW91814.1 ABC transporter permease [Micromonospora globispora]